MEHTVPLDNGARIRDGIKSITKQGVCSEVIWPYNDTPADPDTHLFPPGAPEIQRPSMEAYQDAAQHHAISYLHIPQVLSNLKSCLAEGYPFVFGIAVYDSFESAYVKQTGDVPLPSATDGFLGGHAILAVGYDDATQCFRFRNSWGDQWGKAGYGTIPYAYLADQQLASDFWTIRRILG